MIGEIIEKHDIKGGRYFDAPDSALHLWGEQGWRKSVGKKCMFLLRVNFVAVCDLAND